MKKLGLKRLTALICLVALCVTCLGACGSDAKKDEATPTPKAEESVKPDESTKPIESVEPSDAPATEKVTVTEDMGLKEAYANDFKIGVAINRNQLEQNDILEVVNKNFNSWTMENEMKPENLLDWEASQKSGDQMPKIKTDNLEKILTLAKDNGVSMRGHTLVWHNQTPEWLFCEDYEPGSDYVDKETMLARMEAYIKEVLTYCEENFPGVIYAWDVVNEGVSDENPANYRDSLWYQIIGEEYMEQAFTFARKYAGKDVKLFYNDYNCYSASKSEFIYNMVKNLKEKGVLDGLGLQSHIDMNYPSIPQWKVILKKYGEIPGIELQLTELDMHTTSSDETTMTLQAGRYAELFESLLDLKRNSNINVTSVTFWGLTDADTWLTSFKGEDSYPLLFDADYKPKECFKRILMQAGM